MIPQIWMFLGTWHCTRRQRYRSVKWGSFEVLECRTLLASDFDSLLSGSSLPLQGHPIAEIAQSPEIPVADLLRPPGTANNPTTFSVTFPNAIQVGQLAVPIAIEISTLSANSYLDSWIDWNGDGSWGGAAEHVAANVAITTVNSTLRIDVPAWAQSGTATAMFRLSTATGFEDELRNYEFRIQPPVSPSGQFGESIPIDTTAAMQFTSTADLDRDGDMDILAATFDGSGTIAWYENNASQGFTRHILTTTFAEATCVLTADMNRDGNLDIVVSSLGTSTIAWFENDGHQQFTLHIITDSASQASNLYIADIDGDGDEDVIYSAKGSGSVGWYENGIDQVFTRHIVATDLLAPCAVSAADFDGDGDLDIASGSFSDNIIAWYANDGHQNFTQRIITSEAYGLRGMFVADLDRNGSPDILCSSLLDGQIAWYKNDHGNFVRHSISSIASAACAVYVGDMDGDGDMDVVGASRGNTTIAWFENTDDQDFPMHIITSTINQPRAVIAADLDGDGDLDVISASQYRNRLAWYENHPAALSLTLSSTAPRVTNSQTIPVTLAFSRPVTGLTPESFVVVNGYIANFQGSDANYTFDLIPNSEGTVSVVLPANSVTDNSQSANPEAVLTRQFSFGAPKLTTTDQAITFVRNGLRVRVAPNLIVTGTQLGEGTLVVVIPFIKSTRSRFDVLDDSALNAVGTVTHDTTSDKRVTYVTLFPATTAAEIQAAVRNLTFTTSRRGLSVSTRQIQIQLTDHFGQAGKTLIQTINIEKTPARINLRLGHAK